MFKVKLVIELIFAKLVALILFGKGKELVTEEVRVIEAMLARIKGGWDERDIDRITFIITKDMKRLK